MGAEFDSQDPLDELADSISDGQATTLSEGTESAMSHDERLESTALRDIARIVEFNRGLQRSTESTESLVNMAARLDPAGRWGDLLLLDLVGTGSSGSVWRAWDLRLQREVALKFLQVESELTPSHHDHDSPLLTEARSLARLHHAGVVAVYGIAEHDGRTGMWMEFLHGETLAAAIERRGPLRQGEVARIGRELAHALGAVHEAGLVHRDLKPANVVLEQGGRVVLTDFGLGRRQGSAGDYKRISGTPMFMAPELFDGEAASPRSDLYALGVTLRVALTGRVPFVSQSLAALKAEVARGPATPLGTERPNLSSILVRAIERAMAPNAAERYAEAADLRRALAGERPGARAGASPGLPVLHTLPAERDAFVGREGELEDLEGRLEIGSRLVTLVGSGGMGKTRLAVRYGWQRLEAWPGGVWFCDLTEARDLNGIVSAVARSLGVPLGVDDPVDQLAYAIAGRGPCLLILDNFEQVIRHADVSVDLWLERAPEARFLVTSRERLSLRGEDLVALEPLQTESGVELFRDRARRLMPEFDPQGGETERIAEAVRLADGMPLAIELAAGRVRMMAMDELVARMNERLRILGGTGSGRHASLRAAIDGSWDLLPEWEKSAWAQCAAFEGGFTLEAAASILDLGAWPEAPWSVDVVQSLVEKSLLRSWVPAAGAAGGTPEIRFGMYVSLQEYARMKLEEEGAVTGAGSGWAPARAVEERHGKWFARYGTPEAINALDRIGGAALRRKREREIENLVVACRRAMLQGHGGLSAALYRGMWALLLIRGPYRTVIDLGEEAINDQRLEADDRATFLLVIGTAKRYSGRFNEARSHLEAALSLCVAVGDRAMELAVRDNLANTMMLQGDIDEARTQTDAALAICRELGHREGRILGTLAILDRHQGHMEEAQRHMEAALAIHRETGNRRLEGVVLSNLAVLHTDHGRLDEARAHFEASLAINREVGNRVTEGIDLGNLGNLHCELGRLDEGRRYFEAALVIHREVGHRRFEGVILKDLGALNQAMGNLEGARRHFQSALAICHEVKDLRLEGVLLRNLGSLLHKQGQIQEARDAFATGEALLRQVGAQIDLGRLLAVRAEMELDVGNSEAARSLLHETEFLMESVHSSPNSEFQRKLDQLRQALADRP